MGDCRPCRFFGHGEIRALKNVNNFWRKKNTRMANQKPQAQQGTLAHTAGLDGLISSGFQGRDMASKADMGIALAPYRLSVP